MIELVIRLAFSLAVVLGLVTLLARVSAKRFRGSTDAPIRVVHRQALSRGSAVAVVSVGSRVLVVGTTEQQVSLLTDAKKQMKALDQKTPDGAYRKYRVMGKEFDPAKPAEYAASFSIRKI